MNQVRRDDVASCTPAENGTLSDCRACTRNRNAGRGAFAGADGTLAGLLTVAIWRGCSPNDFRSTGL